MTPEVVGPPAGEAGPPEGEFSERGVFGAVFTDFVGYLEKAEAVLSTDFKESSLVIRTGLEGFVHRVEETFPPAEANLFRSAWGLFCRKHSLGPFFQEEEEFIRKGGVTELTVEIGGGVAVGKSTIADSLAAQIAAQEGSEIFAPGENPFLSLAYENPDFMLRTQLFFLLNSVNDGRRARYHPGRWVRDNSPWSDLIFMKWRARQGIVSQAEFQAYEKLFAILEPTMALPSLLIMLQPTSLDRLWQGLQARIAAEPEKRAMERAITRKDLEVVTQATETTIKELRAKGMKVMEIEVDPVEVWRNPDLKYATVYAIRERLGILKELLTKDPQKVASDIIAIFAANKKPQVVIVHSQSMFTGKTSVLNFVAAGVGQDKVLVFQPQAALRYHEEDHEHNMIDRDRRRRPAQTIASNRLQDVVAWIERQRISPKEKPFVFIDEVMLFVGSRPREAIVTINKLQRLGFSVVADGIDYTFQEKPFTFMYHLIARAFKNPNWHQFEMGTRCKYCDRLARGSRRLRHNGLIANFNDTAYEAGDHYEPVCGENGHVTCLGQPKGFVRRPLPVDSKSR